MSDRKETIKKSNQTHKQWASDEATPKHKQWRKKHKRD